MKDIGFVFSKLGRMQVDNQWVTWHYMHHVTVTLHEHTETFSCRGLCDERCSLHDLKNKLHYKFTMAAKAAARARYRTELETKRATK